MANCVEIVRPFLDAVSDREYIQIMGGVATEALKDPHTDIYEAERVIVARPDLDLPQYREDGTLRDMDALVLTSKETVVDEVRAIAEAEIGERLESSIFGLKPLARLDNLSMHPRDKAGRKQFVSDRYVLDDEPGDVIIAWRALFPFAAHMPLETLATWHLYLGEEDQYPMPVPDPRTNIINYLTRSISGLRPRDEAKVFSMADNITRMMPEARDWLFDGPGASQMELASILQRLSRPGVLAVGNSLSVHPVKGSLRDHRAFMLRSASWPAQTEALVSARVKSRVVRRYESSPRAMTLWRMYGEKRVQKTIHND